jgi:hypothetical protein
MMMPKKKRKDGFERRLKGYSAAAACVLGIAPTANAAIQYSGVKNLPVNSSQSQTIDLNNDGTPDFFFDYYNPFSFWAVYMNSMTGGQGHIGESYHNDPAKLPSNYLIRSTLGNPSFYWASGWNTLNGSYLSTKPYTFYTSFTAGNFNNATGYIGVRFTADCGTAYGWIQYQGMTSLGSSVTGTIIDWAYEDTCEPISVGELRSDVPVPTMNQWGLIVFTLLLGALAARELRRSSSKKGDASA